MKNIAYYHVFLTENHSTWMNIVMEQYKEMEDSDLFANIDDFRVTCVGKNIEDFEIFSHLTRMHFPNAKLTFVENKVPSDIDVMADIDNRRDSIVTENVTSRMIYADAKKSTEDYYILYFHTKGITSTLRHYKNDPNEIDMFRTYHYWRHYLNYGVLENWRSCIEALDNGYDCASVNLQSYPNIHYSGNFWWSKASHIVSLPDPATYEWFAEVRRNSVDPWFRNAPNRFSDEHWITSKRNVKAFNFGKKIPNPTNLFTKRNVYADD